MREGIKIITMKMQLSLPLKQKDGQKMEKNNHMGPCYLMLCLCTNKSHLVTHRLHTCHTWGNTALETGLCHQRNGHGS